MDRSIKTNSLSKFVKTSSNIPMPQCSDDFKLEILQHIKDVYKDDIQSNVELSSEIGNVDIYIPGRKLAIEYNDLYEYSEKFIDKYYFINKVNKCSEEDIRILYIYGDEWEYKKYVVKNRLKHLLGLSDKIFARKCKIYPIQTKEKNEFLDQYHIQGKDASFYNIGAFYNKKLVAVMTLGYSRDNKVALSRFAMSASIVGVASKLWKYILNHTDYPIIVTYADLSYASGNIYTVLGFEKINQTYPDYKYIIDNKRKHKGMFRKCNLVKQGFDPNKSEAQIMKDRGILKIHDCGKVKYEYIRDKI